MKKATLWAVLLSALAINVGHAADTNQVVFLCDLQDGNRVMVEREPVKDAFILSYGKDLDHPTVTLRKLGNNMGTSAHLSSAEGSLGREIYFSDGKLFYTIGYVEGEEKTGYFHLTEETQEKTYSDCKPHNVRSLFGDEAIFASLTEVD